MLFNSLSFLIFFPIVLCVYYLLPMKIRYLWLLVCSYYFYMCWNASYAILILISTVVTYLSGLLLEKAKGRPIRDGQKDGAKKLIVAFSFLINLGILFFFKYFNFTAGIVTWVFAKFHIQLSVPTVDVLLPVGISFYTFQALSYTMDVYRNEIRAEKNFFRYALFVSFFPQLVAGPIERSKNLLTQLARPKSFCFEKARDGFLLMIWGYFLKVVLADRIALFVDTVYGDHSSFPGLYLAVATILFAIQIYCDFSGYSTIAMGAAEILGVDLMENFDAPYLSLSVADFWRRWHISLTSWFKDYLYIPLGGSRKGKFRKYLNKMIVFLVSGLWHGASLSFVIWGGLNGLYQITGEILMPLRIRTARLLRLDPESVGHKAIRGLITFCLVDFAWIFFRSGSYREAVQIIKSMFSVRNPWILMDGSLYTCGLDNKNFGLMMLCIAVLLFADVCKRCKVRVREMIAAQDYWCRYLVMIFAICFFLVFGVWGSGYNAAGFIYFQF